MPFRDREASMTLAREIIKEFEGLSLDAYPDPATDGPPITVGYGHTGPDVRRDMVISQERANELLEQDMHVAASAVDRLVAVPLNAGQGAALIDFTFNLGAGNLEESTLLRKLNDGSYGSVPNELVRWNRAGGVVMAGLARRRRAEVALWNRTEPIPTGSPPPAPVEQVTPQPPASQPGALSISPSPSFWQWVWSALKGVFA